MDCFQFYFQFARKFRERSQNFSHKLKINEKFFFHREKTETNFQYFLSSFIIALRKRNMSRNCTVCRSILVPCHLDSTARDSSPPRHSHNGNYSARQHSNLWMWAVDHLPSRRNFPRRRGRFLMSKNAHCQGLKMRGCEERKLMNFNLLNWRASEIPYQNHECASPACRSLPAMKCSLDACHGSGNIVLL